MKKINSASAYKEHCQSLAQEYIDDIELYVSNLAYDVERSAREGFITNEELKHMVEQKMKLIRTALMFRDEVIRREKLFDL